MHPHSLVVRDAALWHLRFIQCGVHLDAVLPVDESPLCADVLVYRKCGNGDLLWCDKGTQGVEASSLCFC